MAITDRGVIYVTINDLTSAIVQALADEMIKDGHKDAAKQLRRTWLEHRPTATSIFQVEAEALEERLNRSRSLRERMLGR